MSEGILAGTTSDGHDSTAIRPSLIARLLGTHDARMRRLKTAIEDSRRDLGTRAVLPGTEDVRSMVEDAAREADFFANAGNLDTGWALLHTAQRAAVLTYVDADVAALVKSLRSECEEKLRGWRRNAASELLGKPGTVPTRQDVQQAMKTLHENSDNVYHGIDLVREQLRLLAPILFVALLTLAIVLFARWYKIGELEPADLLMIMLVGALGGALSAVRSTAGGRERKIPERLFSSPITLLRPIIGAAAATGVALFLLAGLAKLGDGSKLALLAAAFIAGFSERWFLSMLATAGASTAEKEKN